MKVSVGIKRVINYGVKPRAESAGLGVDLDAIKMLMNPFDEVAIEEAVRLKKTENVNEVFALFIGPTAARDTLRTALAIGADRAIHVKCGGCADLLEVATIFKSVTDEKNPEPVLVGKQANPDDWHQTEQLLADRKVGQTGKVVAPDAHITSGISGAIEHLADMKVSPVIIVINKDREAPVIPIAEYAIVGNLFALAPALTKSVS